MKKGEIESSLCGSLLNLLKIGKVAYKLKIPSELTSVHPVSHVSMLKKYIGDHKSILPIEDLGVKDNLSYDEVSVKILDS